MCLVAISGKGLLCGVWERSCLGFWVVRGGVPPHFVCPQARLPPPYPLSPSHPATSSAPQAYKQMMFIILAASYVCIVQYLISVPELFSERQVLNKVLCVFPGLCAPPSGGLKEIRGRWPLHCNHIWQTAGSTARPRLSHATDVSCGTSFDAQHK